jgi:hypothetical protein
MHNLEPKLLHPYIWALTDILGLSIPVIAKRARISRGVLDRAAEGRPPDDATLRKLRPLLTIALNEALEHHSPHLKQGERMPLAFRFWYTHERFREHRQHALDLVEWIKDAYGANEPRTFKDTDLSAAILQHVGAGEWRQRVMAALKAFHKKSSVKRAAKRIGVRELWKDGKCWWLPPKDITPMAVKRPPMPKVARPKSTSPKSYKVQMALEALLATRDEGIPALDAIDHVKARTGCGTGAVYRAARDLCVIREHTGFGPSKVTRWYSPDAETYERLQEGKVVATFQKAMDKAKAEALALEEVCAWLSDTLEEGPFHDAKLYSMGEARSFTPRIINQAAERLGVVMERVDGKRMWTRPTRST